MLKRILFLVLILVVLLPSGAFAQDEPALQSVEIDLWPEYDRPTVLVIYHITLSPQASLPVDMALRIPAEAEKPNAVAARQADGSLIDLPYEQEMSGEWTVIKFKATTPEVQLEYYDPGLEINGSQRQYEYQWPGDYGVNSLAVQVQQPLGATDMRISPDLGSGTPAQDGMVYYNADAGSLADGQPFTIKLDYQKTSDELSSASLPVQPSAPINANTSGRMTFQQSLPWILGGLGVLLIVGGGVWYWQSGREKSSPGKRVRRRSPGGQAQAAPASEGHSYCHNCGKRAEPGERFCRTCGAELRG